jgi:hypothetical protein
MIMIDVLLGRNGHDRVGAITGEDVDRTITTHLIVNTISLWPRRLPLPGGYAATLPWPRVTTEGGVFLA